ncbi:hypothetical protein NC661_07055 [Aquibacillus koreensis]|uniref:Uncharacterized protein n=1 Tax=Aquibacillus koreensis TaxID=279446 RepID=A0A9X3WKT3_9BACI|nr:hypothetical protein [Aquibacillus koreensis]MCT2535589.1 hypothetical protein [Aquibacillus koreensis]MDC3420126.1 hypothetical protein [Aquibacillus koreensis]
MYLTEVNTLQIIRKQYQFKLKAYVGAFTSLLVMQVTAILFSLGGTGGMSSSDGYLYISGTQYNGSIVIAFTMLWAFISSILITTKAYRNDDFTFVTNRFTSHVSNIYFLLAASIFGGITAMLSGYLLKLIAYLFYNYDAILVTEHAISSILVGATSTIFYILLFSALGYVIGVLVQLSKLFIILIPAFVIGNLFLQAGERVSPLVDFNKVVHFYISESSILLFMVKVSVTILVLFSLSIFITNRMEVK